MARAAILDVDGTLVDTNYQHALAWFRAFRRYEHIVPVWKLHRHVGMGGDKLVGAVAGDDVERELGDEIRAAEADLYQEMLDETERFAGARDLLVDLKREGMIVALASSAKEHELEHYLDVLDARGVADVWTSSADVEATKPDPDLVHAALAKAGSDDAVMVGDTGWDCQAAARAGIETICVRTGGWAAEELYEAGATAVFESVEELRSRRGETSLTAR